MVYTPFARTAESIGAENVDLDRLGNKRHPGRSSGGAGTRNLPSYLHSCSPGEEATAQAIKVTSEV